MHMTTEESRLMHSETKSDVERRKNLGPQIIIQHQNRTYVRVSDLKNIFPVITWIS